MWEIRVCNIFIKWRVKGVGGEGIEVGHNEAKVRGLNVAPGCLGITIIDQRKYLRISMLLARKEDSY